MKLNAKQLRDLSEEGISHNVKRNPMYLVLDDIYDTYNIGGLFRLADALNVTKLYICGGSETPPNHKIKKASIGTYKIVAWAYKKTAVEAIKEIREHEEERGYKANIVAVEQDNRSVPYETFAYTAPLGLVVGNETSGCTKETLSACDATVEIPMHGLNVSLNVIVSAAIVGYHASMNLDKEAF